VEALTIVLAVGLFRGWRPAFAGTALAALALIVIVVVLGTAVDSFPVEDAQVVVGMFLLLFGLRWLHKAILRQAGLKALHDEAEEFEATKEALSTREHWVAVTTAFNGVLLEGVEVVLIVIALGGVGHRAGAAVGATAALLAVIVAGIALRAPLTRIPENLMKASVGVMLTSFGIFFVC
jgi:Ca2+/H+ antiporter, TMEM165/GDT1 family